MKEKQELTIPSQGSMIRDFIMRVKLIWALMKDGRVSAWLKLIPVAGLVYLIMPIDLVSEIALPLVGELDDAAVLWLTNYIFLEMCPPELVLQHVKTLVGSGPREDAEDIVDAESVEIKEPDK